MIVLLGINAIIWLEGADSRSEELCGKISNPKKIMQFKPVSAYTFPDEHLCLQLSRETQAIDLGMMQCRAVISEDVSPKLVLRTNVNTLHRHGEHAVLLKSSRQLYLELSGEVTAFSGTAFCCLGRAVVAVSSE